MRWISISGEYAGDRVKCKCTTGVAYSKYLVGKTKKIVGLKLYLLFISFNNVSTRRLDPISTYVPIFAH